MKNIQEKAKWNPIFRINKFASQSDYEAGKLLEEVIIEGNKLTNAGINNIWTLVAGTGGEQFGTDANLIVGTGTGDETASDTESTFTNGVKKPMSDGYPTYGTSQKVTYKAVFDGTSANQAWNEFGVLSKSSGGILLNRKVSAQGTKTAGQVWELELEIELQ
jgi:hypothetical protein